MSIDETLFTALGPYLATLVGFGLAFLLLAYVLRRHERQSASIAWMLVIVLFPVVGVPAYLIFAGRKLAVRARAKQKLHGVEHRHAPRLEGMAAEVEGIVRGYGIGGATDGNRVTLLGDGERAYRELMECIDGARERICITTFALGRDRVGKATRIKEKRD